MAPKAHELQFIQDAKADLSANLLVTLYLAGVLCEHSKGCNMFLFMAFAFCEQLGPVRTEPWPFLLSPSFLAGRKLTDQTPNASVPGVEELPRCHCPVCVGVVTIPSPRT